MRHQPRPLAPAYAVFNFQIKHAATEINDHEGPEKNKYTTEMKYVAVSILSYFLLKGTGGYGFNPMAFSSHTRCSKLYGRNLL